MALTIQQDGEMVGGLDNTITASWFNDYHDLLTGTMTDQPVTLKTGVKIRAIGANPAAGPVLSVVAGSGLGIGAYQYQVTFVDGSGGESIASPTTSATTTSGNQKINLTSIPTGATGVTKRNLYRTAVGGSTFKLLSTLNDNSTTSFTDTTADASLGSQNPPSHSSLGALFIQDSTGTTQITCFNDGVITTSNALSIRNGQTVPTIRSAGGGAAGITIWVGTTDPGGSAQEGDVWLKG